MLLAGGSGRRLGGAKPTTELAGRPLIAWPAAALAEVCAPLAVVCKRQTELPHLPAVERWDEPDEPRHPLTGIIHALERAEAPVLVCAADMPFVTPDACRTLVEGAAGLAAVATAEGRLQPVLGVYAPAALPLLRAAEPDAPLTRVVEALEPGRVALPPPIVRSVNTPEDLRAAEALLAGRGQ